MKRLKNWVAVGQGVFYLLTGLWPLVSRRSFERVTGPKVDFWLVRTVGLLLALTGAVLTSAGLRGSSGTVEAALGAGTSAALASIDIATVRRGRIGRIYLLDALAELGWIAAWAAAALMDEGIPRRRIVITPQLAPVLED